MLPFQIARCVVVVTAVVGLWVAENSWAQQPGQEKSGAAAANQTTVAANSAAASAKEKLLASPVWKQVYGEFQKWLASQAIYTPADVERIKANLAAQIQAMPVSDVQGFLDDWQARLKVLQGRDFQEAQDWLGQNLSVMADGFRRRTLKDSGLSDIASMSAGELEEAIIRIRADRLTAQQRQAAFDQNRRQMVQRVQQSNAAAREARQQTRSVAAQFGTNQSPYRPPKFNPLPPPRQQFFVDGDGRIGFVLPF